MQGKLPPLRAIQVFEAVARTGSVTAAAQELHISAGAVSQQIRKLEGILDLPLLERRGKGVALSRWGQLYQRELKAVFVQLHRASAVLESAREEQGLVISCLSSVASKWLGLQLFDWRSAHPQARVRLTGTDVEPDLSRAQVDFRITYGAQALKHEHHLQLHTDSVVAACAPALLNGQPSLQAAQVLALPLIGIEWEKDYGAIPGWEEWARSLDVRARPPKPSLAFAQAGAAIDAALAGHGVVLAQSAVLKADLDSGRLVVPFEHRLPLPEAYYLAWNPASLYRPFARDLYQWLQQISLPIRALETASELIARCRVPERGD